MVSELGLLLDHEMKAYYFDNAEGDQRLPHFDESLPPVDVNTFEKIGVKYWFIPVDQDGNWEQVRFTAEHGRRRD